MPVEPKAELELERLVLVERPIEQLAAMRRERLQSPRSEAERSVVHLMRLGAIGPTSAKSACGNETEDKTANPKPAAGD